ncbi:UUP1 family membrane protein [Ferrimonas lipolytica]|uniref:UUP1 family membrane protein n=1 Tax=Ferrimonas lipolytica TaxID=2724191 RepID=A0A6H1UCT1_9GAMM|nr:UUP1 family membrane protein [Ferrimonas lipolytica]QIZ76439.1 UUP1 family membrane protein [Ferrimonas lipolytica]
MSRKPFYLLILTLLIVGLGYSGIRHSVDGIPLLPATATTVWTIEARVSFEGQGPVEASLALPGDPNFTLMSESPASNGYGLTVVEKGSQRRAFWTRRDAAGTQELFYTTSLKVNDSPVELAGREQQPVPEVVWDASVEAAARALISDAHAKSADNLSFTRQLVQLFKQSNKQQNVALLSSRYDNAELFVRLLHSAGIPAAKVMGLSLEDGRRRQSLEPWVEVNTNDHWVLFNPRTGVEGRPENLLLWQRYGESVLDVTGGNNSKLSFSMIEETRPALATALDLMSDNGLSIYNLPLEEQSLLRGLFLIPIGVLVVVFLRVIIGLKTSGTFMPVLIALAFIQTKLLTGLVGFLLIVACGLVIRSYLSNLNLLLISRISAVVIVVLGIIAGFTLIAFNLGLTEGLTITFFPMIILAWTIERMSILWEEEGAHEVFIQGGGSLLVAVITYLAMDNDLVRHWAYNFLGIHLVILALILWMGQYTGYRLLELRRFAPLAKDD